MPNLISAFKDLDCKANVYWGTSAGRSHYFGDYFRGLAYAMSWPLVSSSSLLLLLFLPLPLNLLRVLQGSILIILLYIT
jgi:hypothetical protein